MGWRVFCVTAVLLSTQAGAVELSSCSDQLKLLDQYVEKKILTKKVADDFVKHGGRFVMAEVDAQGQELLHVFYIENQSGLPVIRLKKVSLNINAMNIEEQSLLAHEFNHFEFLIHEQLKSESLSDTWNRSMRNVHFLSRSERSALVREYQFRRDSLNSRSVKTGLNSVSKGQLLLSTWTYPESSSLREGLRIFGMGLPEKQKSELLEGIDRLLTVGIKKVDVLQRSVRPLIERRVLELSARENTLDLTESAELEAHRYSIWSLNQEKLDILLRGAGGAAGGSQLASWQIDFLKTRIRELRLL